MACASRMTPGRDVKAAQVDSCSLCGAPEHLADGCPRLANPRDRFAVGNDGRPGWDDYFLALAATVATRADCTRRQVGAVLVGPDRRVLSTGYNGAPSGVPGCASAGACPRGRQSRDAVPSRSDYADGSGACIARHAEANAVEYARPKSRAGATMYVTCEPCPQCWALLEAVGIVDVHWPAESD